MDPSWDIGISHYSSAVFWDVFGESKKKNSKVIF